MTGPACLVYSEDLTAYDFGPGHPLAPIRVRLTVALARELGVLDSLQVVAPPVADDEVIQAVHTKGYVDAVKRASADPLDVTYEHGLGSTDNPAFVGMHDASAHVVGASVEAARRVWQGEALHAANITGGLHHAMPDTASGFCVYNDPAVAIRWLLDQGCPKVAYVDIDVHHGDGVQEVFYDDPRVLTVSLHETPRTLFPGVSGFPTETGAEGTAVNLAFPAGTTDAGWLRGFHAVVPELLKSHQPTVLLTQHGCDSHALDPLAHLMLSVDGQRAATLALHQLAHDLCDGRWVATGGGGYALVDVVPRTWSHLLGIVGDHLVDPGAPVPAAWRDLARDVSGRPAPEFMGDGVDPVYADWSTGYNPADPVDQAILATRRAVFPAHGLDPEY